MKVGLQLFTLREFMQDETSIYETFRKADEMGYKVIQVSGIGKFTKEKGNIIKAASEKHQLEIAVTHVGLDQIINDFDLIVKIHKLWNCEYIGVGMMPDKYHNSIEGYQEFIDIMNDLGVRLNQEGLHLVYHNHAFEFRKFGDKTGLEILLEGFSPYVQMELDTYWIQKGGQSPVTWINKVKGRMDIVHFKDMGINGWDNQIMESVGAGNLDWDAIIEACLNTKVKYALVEQDDCQGRDPFDCVKYSLEFLKSKGL